MGEPKVTDIIPAEGYDESSLLKLACTLEKNSEHPLAKAVIDLGTERNIIPDSTENFTALAGNGLSAVSGGKKLLGGSVKFISSQADISEEMKKKSEALAEEGKTPLMFTCDGAFCRRYSRGGRYQGGQPSGGKRA